MLIIGLAGQAGSGKSTIADYLARHYGFVQFAFSDALYHEVQQAFSLPDQTLLRDRATKEYPTERLALINCQDEEFIGVAEQFIAHEPRHLHEQALSPRQILQWWGTEYRRAQDPDYWIKQATNFIYQMRRIPPYPELRPALFAETGTRFENERGWIMGSDDWLYPNWIGNIWHIHRDATNQVTDPHASAKPLPVLPGEREIWNNSTIEHLEQAVDLLLSSSTQFVKCEPLEPMENR